MHNAMILYNSAKRKQLTDIVFGKSAVKSLFSQWRVLESIPVTIPRFRPEKDRISRN